MVGGVDLSQDNSTPKGAEGPRGDETQGSLTAARYRRGEDKRGRGGGDKKPPTTQATRVQAPDGGNRAAQQGGNEGTEEATETAAGAGGAGYLPKHFDSAAGATTENGKHKRREYDKVASEAS